MPVTPSATPYSDDPARLPPHFGDQQLKPLPEQPPTLRQRVNDWFAGAVQNWAPNLPGGLTSAQQTRQQNAAQANAILAARQHDPALAPPADATQPQIDSLNDQAWEQSRQAVGGMSQIPQLFAQRALDAASFGLAAPAAPVQPHSGLASAAGVAGTLAGAAVSTAPAAALSKLRLANPFIARAATLGATGAAQWGSRAMLDARPGSDPASAAAPPAQPAPSPDPAAPDAAQDVQRHLANPGYGELRDGVYAYKGRAANGVMQYGDAPFQGGQLGRMGGQSGVNFAGDARLYAGDGAGAPSPEQREQLAGQLSAQRIASYQRTAELGHDNAVLRDRLSGNPAPGTYILGNPDHPDDPDGRVARYDQFRQQADQNNWVNSLRDPRARELIGTRMMKMQLEREQAAQRAGVELRGQDVQARGQDLNYQAETARNGMTLRNVMMQRELDLRRMQTEQYNKDRQYGLDQYRAGLDGGRLTLEQRKQDFDAQQRVQKSVQDQVAAMVPAGPDGKPDAAAAARYAQGVNSFVTRRIQALQAHLAQNPQDAQARQDLLTLQRDGPAALGQSQLRQLVAGQRLTDMIQDQGSGRFNPIGSTVVNSTDPIEWVREHPALTGTEFWSNRGDRINARDLRDGNGQLPRDVLDALRKQPEGN